MAKSLCSVTRLNKGSVGLALKPGHGTGSRSFLGQDGGFLAIPDQASATAVIS